MKAYKTGVTFGAFDPIHFGHIKLFERAKEQCDELIVCVSNASYIREMKGHDQRLAFAERLKAVESIRYVDKVRHQTLAFGKRQAVKDYEADVIFVGDDWNPATFNGEGLGVPVVYLPYTAGISSTKLSI